MGIISIEKSGRLFWLGRYTERVFTTLKLFYSCFDEMLEKPDAYRTFLQELTLPDIYDDASDFASRYLFGRDNPDSICANLNRAYDNAIVLREDLTSEMQSYIQMALDRFRLAKTSSAPLMALQPVLDDLYAFWGCALDCMESEKLAILRCGQATERFDLYLRLHYAPQKIAQAYLRFEDSLGRVHLQKDRQQLGYLRTAMEQGAEPDESAKQLAIFNLEHILQV